MTVTIKWVTPDADAMIAELARVSNPANQQNTETAPRLIAYCIRKQHWSIFDMANMCVEVNTTRDIGRQMLRHWSMLFHDLKVQEFSQRYADVSALGEPVFREARMQDTKNRQNSVETQDAFTKTWWQDAQSEAWDEGSGLYTAALARGIAKEQARAVLPEGITPTRFYVNGTARQWMHYCALRMDPGTQKEHRDIATVAWLEFSAAFPKCADAASLVSAEKIERALREEMLADAVTKAAAQFRFYEEQHRAKGTPDGAVKADVNRQLAEELESMVMKSA